MPNPGFHPASDGQLFDSIGGVRASVGKVNFRQGTTAPTAFKLDACSIRVQGVDIPVAAAEPALTASTHDIAANNEAIFLLYLNPTSGALTVVKGATVAGVGAAVDPTTVAASLVAIGRCRIRTTVTFTAATSSLSLAGVTTTFEDRALPLNYSTP